MNFTDFLKPELAALPLVLYVVGLALKKAKAVKNNLIPLVLGGCGIVLAALYVLATTPVATVQDVALAVFIAVVQGVLCAAASVYANQIYKQAGA